ncbi:MAG: pilus assembly PilX N-terminal domain-containing protein [Candidatus Saganbacteria bacterium]|nr:pilus assembly PilX N-terminal domain-containing protein [Candidatus Saganbacteria bacterium]
MKIKSKGFSLIASIFVMIIFLMLGMTMVQLLSGQLISASKEVNYTNALYMAEAGAHYAANRLLKNDYDWMINNLAPGATVVPMRIDNNSFGYPCHDSGDNPSSLFIGNWDYNRISREIRNQLDNSIGSFQVDITNVKPLFSGPINGNIGDDPHFKGEFLWSEAKIVSGGYASGSESSIEQHVKRYLCPTLKYAVSAGQGDVYVGSTASAYFENYDYAAPPNNVVLSTNPGKESLPSEIRFISSGNCSTSWGTGLLFNNSPDTMGGQPIFNVAFQNDQWFPMRVEIEDFRKIADNVVTLQTLKNDTLTSFNAPYGTAGGYRFGDGPVVLGSPTQPIRYFKNGDLKISGDVTVYGSIFVNGNIIIEQSIEWPVPVSPRTRVRIISNPNNNNEYMPALVANENITTGQFNNNITELGSIEVEGLIHANGYVGLKLFYKEDLNSIDIRGAVSAGVENGPSPGPVTPGYGVYLEGAKDASGNPSSIRIEYDQIVRLAYGMRDNFPDFFQPGLDKMNNKIHYVNFKERLKFE